MSYGTELAYASRGELLDQLAITWDCISRETGGNPERLEKLRKIAMHAVVCALAAWCHQPKRASAPYRGAITKLARGINPRAVRLACKHGALAALYQQGWDGYAALADIKDGMPEAYQSHLLPLLGRW